MCPTSTLAFCEPALGLGLGKRRVELATGCGFFGATLQARRLQVLLFRVAALGPRAPLFRSLVDLVLAGQHRLAGRSRLLRTQILLLDVLARIVEVRHGPRRLHGLRLIAELLLLLAYHLSAASSLPLPICWLARLAWPAPNSGATRILLHLDTLLSPAGTLFGLLDPAHGRHTLSGGSRRARVGANTKTAEGNRVIRTFHISPLLSFPAARFILFQLTNFQPRRSIYETAGCRYCRCPCCCCWWIYAGSLEPIL